MPAHPSLYPSYAEYIDMLVSRGGIIEAAPECEESKISSPSLFFKIDPDGQITVLCAYDRLLSREYVNYACAFPQTSLPNLNIKQLCTSVGNNLYSKGVYGYITVAMAAFPDVAQKGHPLFWMIGLDVYLNQLSSGFFAFDFLTKGVIDKVSGRYFLAPKDNSNILGAENQSESNALEEFEERSYIYVPFLLHDGLSKYNYRDFFQLCRKSQISYDLEKKLGYVLHFGLPRTHAWPLTHTRAAAGTHAPLQRFRQAAKKTAFVFAAKILFLRTNVSAQYRILRFY